MTEFLAFLLHAVTSPEGVAVACLHVLGIWGWVGVLTLARRRAERAKTPPVPLPARAQKRLIHQETHRAA